ncbi:MAG: hypothetical protein ACTS8R_00345 [Arsenophonus sp. NC-QC1-MAG3]
MGFIKIISNFSELIPIVKKQMILHLKVMYLIPLQIGFNVL